MCSTLLCTAPSVHAPLPPLFPHAAAPLRDAAPRLLSCIPPVTLLPPPPPALGHRGPWSAPDRPPPAPRQQASRCVGFLSFAPLAPCKRLVSPSHRPNMRGGDLRCRVDRGFGRCAGFAATDDGEGRSSGGLGIALGWWVPAARRACGSLQGAHAQGRRRFQYLGTLSISSEHGPGGCIQVCWTVHEQLGAE